MSVIVESQPQSNYPPRPQAVVWPPAPVETNEGRARRMAQQREALRISQAIDMDLAKERAERTNKAPQMTLLLLGESSSSSLVVRRLMPPCHPVS